MVDRELGQYLVNRHLGGMNTRSRESWPPIVEREGFQIVADRAYQGFDGGVHPWWTADRFWCRCIEVRRESDGAIGTGYGPQADAYNMAIDKIEGADHA
jgi:hypothetical protein